MTVGEYLRSVGARAECIKVCPPPPSETTFGGRRFEHLPLLEQPFERAEWAADHTGRLFWDGNVALVITPATEFYREARKPIVLCVEEKDGHRFLGLKQWW